MISICSFLIISCNRGHIKDDFKGKTVHLNATDGLPVTADLYMTDDKHAPLIILYHQAGFSRGEYRSIAPQLNKLGFNCLTLDQRSGKEVNGVENETYKKAVNLNKKTEYVNAIPDIEGAFLYAKKELKSDKIILWGSSYSAALVFYMGSIYGNEIKGILAFSPGEYFKIDGKKIMDFARDVHCPVFITSSKNEEKEWKGIYESVKSDKSYFLPESKGFHGSKALWSANEGNEEYWKAVEDFLVKIK